MSLNLFNYLSLGLIFGISILILFEDIKNKKIRNKWIGLGLLAGLLLFLIALGCGLINFNYLLKVFVNALISFLVGFVIWYLGLWPAGDAKFFTLISFLLPLHYYWKSYLDYFPSFALLVNIFCLFLVFLALKSVYYFLFGALSGLFENKEMKKDLVRKYLSRMKKGTTNFFYLLYKNFLIDKDSNFKKFFVVLLLFFLMSILFSHKNLFIPFVVFLIIVFLGILIYLYINKYSKEIIKAENLNSKLNLATETILELQKNKNFFKKLGALKPGGLRDYQVNLIKEYLSSQNIQDVYIYKSISFSFWIILGAVLTILFKGSVMQLLFKAG